MPVDKDQESSGQLLTSATDWIHALPSPEVIGDELWREPRVDLNTWLYDKAYMGLGKIRLSPIQLEFLTAMDDIDPNTNDLTEFVGQWGKGSGKDFICALAALRQVYSLLCMRDPYEYYGLAKGTGIQIVNVAYTKEQAKGVFLNQVKGLLRGSLWFMKHKWLITREKINFAEFNIDFISGAADGDSIEGNNLFFGVMDEASAFKDGNQVKAMKADEGTKVKHAADRVYDVLRTSSRSRFPTVGKVVIISYPRYKDDFTQVKCKENADSPNGFVSGPYATWEVNPRIKRSDFDEDYRKNPEMADAMYACKPPWSADGYVKWPERFVRAAARGNALGLESPIDKEGAFALDFRGLPGRYYAIHVDLALNRDGCAIALGRQGEPVIIRKCRCKSFNLKDVDRCAKCGTPYDRWEETELPTCVITLLKLFKPKGEKGEVDFGDVREEILWIRDRGHKIWALSYDGWQSVDSRQIMQDTLGKRKVRDRWGKNEREEDIVTTLSVDRNTEAHDTLKEMIYDDRFFIYAPEDFNEIELAAGEKRTQDTLWEKSDAPVAMAFREWRKLKLINGKKVDHPLGGCFTGETRIPLLDGSCPQISELAGKGDIWLYSAKSDGTIVPSKAKGFLSKHVTELIDVVLDSGAVVRCTPEHRFMLRNGSYKEARHLVPDLDRLMPITRQWPRNGGYECVSDRNGKRVPTHRMVMQALAGLNDTDLVHHLDEDKINNHPENLQIIDNRDHARHHTTQRHNTNPAYRDKVSRGLQAFNLSEEGRRKHSISGKAAMGAWTTEQRREHQTKYPGFRSDVRPSALEAIKDSSDSANAAAKQIGCGRNVIIRVLRDMGFDSWKEFKAASTGANHRVRYIIPVQLAESVPVYDLEVPVWHNFALSAGVFVHNSKDLVDALAGVAFHVSQMPIIRDRKPIFGGWSERNQSSRATRSRI